MNLTTKDLKAIREIVNEVVDGKLVPIIETQKEILKAQVDVVTRIEFIGFQIEGLKPIYIG
ncbi:MAG TPA: hypothetical protein VFE50_13515 [Cyclobacteriaceae bacterium]|nr:hypothetical protein [Cyclobacteriaceae bacterium]